MAGEWEPRSGHHNPSLSFTPKCGGYKTLLHSLGRTKPTLSRAGHPETGRNSADHHARMPVLPVGVVMREETEVEVLSYRAFCDRQTLEAWRRRKYEYDRDRGESPPGERYRGPEASHERVDGSA